MSGVRIVQFPKATQLKQESAVQRDGLAGTHHARRERLEVVQRLIAEHDYQLKFVVESPRMRRRFCATSTTGASVFRIGPVDR